VLFVDFEHYFFLGVTLLDRIARHCPIEIFEEEKLQILLRLVEIIIQCSWSSAISTEEAVLATESVPIYYSI
jgi:hypothetical protein